MADLESKFKVTVIIPHYNGEAILRRCLLSLMKTEYSDYSILLVDNRSTDNSITMVQSEFPNVQILKSDINRGYAGGCNWGIEQSQSPYLVLMNNDTEVTPEWLGALVEMMELHPDAAAVQPKILSLDNRKQFDYCGASGGEMDIFGYPFARGRMFNVMENDEGQYDQSVPVFWATGAVMLIRRSALQTVGLFEAAFFAHMEEIDLCWRFHLAGFNVYSVPRVVVYHQTGGTLGQESLRKMVFNHRNNLLMIFRNYSWQSLAWLFPVRCILELGTIIFSLITAQWKRALAILIAVWGVFQNLSVISNGRRQVRRIRKISDKHLVQKLYPGSVAIAFFLLKKKRFQDL